MTVKYIKLMWGIIRQPIACYRLWKAMPLIQRHIAEMRDTHRLAS